MSFSAHCLPEKRCHISHSTPDFPPRIEALRDRLLLMPVAPLTTLTAMLPERFLHFLDLTVMERSTTEFTWQRI